MELLDGIAGYAGNIFYNNLQPVQRCYGQLGIHLPCFPTSLF